MNELRNGQLLTNESLITEFHAIFKAVILIFINRNDIKHFFAVRIALPQIPTRLLANSGTASPCCRETRKKGK
jgi:hypothetical protein